MIEPEYAEMRGLIDRLSPDKLRELRPHVHRVLANLAPRQPMSWKDLRESVEHLPPVDFRILHAESSTGKTVER